MKHSHITSFLLIGLTAIFTKVSAYEFKLQQGIDNNPYEISQPGNSSSYADIYMGHDGAHKVSKKTEYRYSFDINGRKYYETEASAADKLDIDVRLRSINRFKVNGKSLNLLLTADWNTDRGTYFSQRTRQVATTSRGQSIADRFDYDNGKLAAEVIYRFNRKHSLGLYSYISRRNYLNDYEDINLEALDFTEAALQPTYRYKSESGLYLRSFVYYKRRTYDDLLNDNINGRNIPDSKLRYNMYGYGFLVNKTIAGRLFAQVYASGYFSRDNAEGYRDLDYHKLALKFEYKINDTSELVLDGYCYIRDYKQDSARPVESEFGDSGRKRTGCKSELSYSTPFPFLNDENIRLTTRLATENESNSENRLSFDKFEFGIGVSYQF